MAKPLRVLLIDDSDDDVELVLREIRRGGYEPDWQRVDTAPALLAAVRARPWDLVICDDVLSPLSAAAALKILRESGRGLPVIIVAGQVDEEVAVAAMKAGADDVVSKRRMTRLLPAIERELAAATLREPETRFRDLVESLHDVVFEVGSDDRLTYVSPSVAAFGGFGPEAYVGRSFRDIVHPDDLPTLLASLERTLAGARDPLVYRITGPRGQVRWVRTSSRPIFDADGTLVALRGVMTDVTDQVEAVEAYRTIFEQSKDGLAVVLGNHLRLVNPAFAAITGWSIDALTATPIAEINERLVHPDDVERQRRLTRRYLDGHRDDAPFAFRIVRPDGGVRHIVAARADFPFGGQAARLITYVDDTERWQAELAYRTIFEGAIHGMLLIQGKRIVMANPAVAQITGRSLDVLAQPLPQVAGDVVHPDDLEGLRTHLDRWLSLGQVPARYSFRIRRADDTEGLLYTQTAIVSHQGAPAALVTVADLTDRWRAEEAYRAVFERSLVGLLVIGEPHVLMANQAAAELTGYAVDALAGTTTPDLLDRLLPHPDDRATLAAELAACQSGSTALHRHAVRIRRRDGSERRMLTACAPMPFAGRPAVLFSLLDVTDR